MRLCDSVVPQVCILLLLALLYSCQKREKSTVVSSPKNRSIQGQVIATDTMPPPEVLPLGSLKEVPLGEPQIRSFGDSSQPLVANFVKKTGRPRVLTMGTDSLPLPPSKPVRVAVVRAKAPKVNPAKAPFTQDYNPHNLVNYGLAEGLVDGQIHDMMQDSKGNIWFGSFNGISKFNGKTFENYGKAEGLIDEFAETFYEDSQGNIWIGFRDGATKFDGQFFTNYVINEGMSHVFITSIIEDQSGQMWFGTLGNGIAVLSQDGKKITHFTEKQGIPKDINVIFEDQNHHFWFGTNKGGVLKYDFKSFYQYTLKEGLYYNEIMDICQDKKGDLWLATYSGVTQFGLDSCHHYIGLTASWIWDLTCDAEGKLWLASDANGIFKIDKTQTSIQQISEKQGLLNNSVKPMMEDNQANLWIGTNVGAVKYNQRFRSYTKADGLIDKSVVCLSQDAAQNLWVGTDYGGLSVLDFQKKQIKNYTTQQGLSNDYVVSLMNDSQNNTWVGSIYGGIVRVNAHQKTVTHFTDSGTYVVCIFEDQAGNIWYSSRQRGGVFRISKDYKTVTRYTPKQGLPHDQVVRIWQDKAGNMWFCTFNGASRLSKDGKTFLNFTPKEGATLGVVQSILEDKYGNFWFSTLSNGISKLDLKQSTIRQFTTEDGLINNTVFELLEDHRGDIWLATRQGLSILSQKSIEQLQNPANPAPIYFRNYTQENGYVGMGGGRFSIIEDEKHQVWITMLDKLMVVDNTIAEEKNAAPKVEIVKVKPFNEPIEWQRDSSYTLKNGLQITDFSFDSLSLWNKIPLHLSLSHQNNYLTFEFVGINTHSPQKVRYQYMLEGLEKTWSVPSPQAEASYGNLSTGKYTFKVKAMNSDGGWSDEVAYPFTIRPPFWQTWWAYLLYLVAFFASIYYIIQVRVQQRLQKIKELEAIRLRISSNLHDDVGTILSGLAMQSEMLALTTFKDQKDTLYEIRDMSHDAMERMRDTVWAIDSRKDKYENLIDRMRAYVEKNLNLKNIKHTFNIEVEDAKAAINPEMRQNLYLILKEAITNICKHSDATQVNVVFRQNKKSLYLLIHDNGNPKTATNTDGMGLHNMTNRAKAIGATLNINRENGYKVELSL